eukprot:TRINITY_DN16269_c0_g1_i1.p1 TRINITY_DN16269_c0_g1~~TRINITY_DN16269_c0_g1_i1.p1  ORF type:complete len:104 (-),score=9.11 TRINITY_DN16269_c0_g1_i1:24-335(-)
MLRKNENGRGFKLTKNEKEDFITGLSLPLKFRQGHFCQKKGAPPLLEKEAFPLISRCKILGHFIFRDFASFALECVEVINHCQTALISKALFALEKYMFRGKK